MKKLIIVALLLTSIFSFAQEVQSEKNDKKVKRERMSPEQRNQFLLDKMTKELNLDAQQQEQIKPIIAEQNAKMQEMREQGRASGFQDISKAERKALMQKRNEEKTLKDNKLKAILTPEQFKKMKEMEAANKEKMVEARKARQNQQE
jgi:Spy/CpxP family protein refolding chaperone